MSHARNTTAPDADGMYRTWCDPCDMSATFPDLAMAVEARRHHLCEGEVPSCSWPGWNEVEMGRFDDDPNPYFGTYSED